MYDFCFGECGIDSDSAPIKSTELMTPSFLCQVKINRSTSLGSSAVNQQSLDSRPINGE